MWRNECEASLANTPPLPARAFLYRSFPQAGSVQWEIARTNRGPAVGGPRDAWPGRNLRVGSHSAPSAGSLVVKQVRAVRQLPCSVLTRD